QLGRYESLCQQKRLGIVGPEEAARIENQIRWGVLELLSKLKQEGFKPELPDKLAFPRPEPHLPRQIYKSQPKRNPLAGHPLLEEENHDLLTEMESQS